MNDNFVLVEYSSALNNIIAKTFKNMRRVKLTCVDVSKNFLIFGASSGGIYIFKREPCEFLKLIPSKEGSTNLLVISSDEKHIAIASIKGIIIVIRDFLGDMELFYQVYKEHDRNIITSMNWNGNDLYCGDNTGKVSVVTFTSLLKYFPVITYDLWDDIIKLVIRLKEGICLNCGDEIDTEGAISWTDLGQFIVTSVGAVNTVKLLQRHAKFITKGDLDARFYHTCIFTASINAGNKPESQLAVNLVNKSENSSFSNQFENLMEKYLQKKYLGKEKFPTKSTEKTKEKRCSLCKLPLNIPILDEISEKDCGHIFHGLCLMEINNTCNICKYG